MAGGKRLCKRGVQYRYCLSSQGMKYVRWLQGGGKVIEDFRYAELISEVLSYLPDELKDRLSMLSLAKAARRYKGPNRNTNLLESNVVPVIYLSIQNKRLRSEKEKLELENAIQKFKLGDLQQTISNYGQHYTSLYIALIQVIFWAASHKNSADYWRRQFEQAFRRLPELSGPVEATLGRDDGNNANLLNPISGVDAPSFDPLTGIAEIPAVCKGTGIPAFSLRIPWIEYYGNTCVFRDITPEGSGRILATEQITPETVRSIMGRRGYYMGDRSIKETKS